MRACFQLLDTLQYAVYNIGPVYDKQAFVALSASPQCDLFGDVLLKRDLPLQHIGVLSKREWMFCNLRSYPCFERQLQVAIAGNHSMCVYDPETFANEAYNVYVFARECLPLVHIVPQSKRDGIDPGAYDINVDLSTYKLSLRDYQRIFVHPEFSLITRRQEYKELNIEKSQSIAKEPRGVLRRHEEAEMLAATAIERLKIQHPKILWNVAETIALMEQSSIIMAMHVAEAVYLCKESIVWEP